MASSTMPKNSQPHSALRLLDDVPVRVLVSTFPGKGHFHPVAPFALELQSRGHDVVVATGDDLVAWVRGCGLTARPAGLREEDAVRLARAEAPPGVPFGPYMFARIAAAPMLRDLRCIAADWQPNLVVHEEAEYAAPLFAAERGVPCITHSWPAPTVPVSARRPIADWLQDLWEGAGLGPARMVGDVYLDSCPPQLQTPDISGVPNVRQVRPVLFDGPISARADDLGDLSRPFVYVTFGTVPLFARADVLTKAAIAASRHAASVLVTTGPVAPHQLGALPANVRVEAYVPQRQPLAHADLLISHGGAGSNLGALVQGVPHLVLPQGAPSQQRCGDQVARLGTGIAIPPGEQSLANISAGVEAALHSESFRRAAQRAADAIGQVPPLGAVINDVLAVLGVTSNIATPESDE